MEKYLVKKMESVEEAFKKTGGKVLNSTWLLGYKIIIPDPVLES